MHPIRSHWTYANVMSTLAVVLVIGGGAAYAANTVGSADIIDESILSQDIKNGQLGTGDLAGNAVRTAKVLDESLTGHDIQDDTIGGADVNESLLDPLTSGQIANESLTGHDIQNNTIGGADVNESLLDPMTSAQIQNESLTGHDIQDDTIGGADVNESLLDGVAYTPAFANHSAAFDLPANGSDAQVIYTGDGVHGDPEIHVRAPGVVMASATLNFSQLHPGYIAHVTCELGLVRPDGVRIAFGEPIHQDLAAPSSWPYYRASIALSAAKTVNTPGDYFVNAVCSSADALPGQPFDIATFGGGSLIAWAT